MQTILKRRRKRRLISGGSRKHMGSRIVVVDDDTPSLEALPALLTAWGYEATAATDGRRLSRQFGWFIRWPS